MEPVVDRENNTYRFEIRTGKGKPPEGTVNRRGGTCLLSGAPMPFDYIRSEGKAGRMGARLMAIVAEGPNGRVYLPPSEEHEEIARTGGANLECPIRIYLNNPLRFHDYQITE